MMNIYQKRASLFSLFSAIALMSSQLLKGSFEIAPLIGFGAGLIFAVLALIMATKAGHREADN
ncbi:MAG: hypothetical protein ABFD04_16455 [Syntrophomonas sp.]